jgi:hypothetical protein
MQACTHVCLYLPGVENGEDSSSGPFRDGQFKPQRVFQDLCVFLAHLLRFNFFAEQKVQRVLPDRLVEGCRRETIPPSTDYCLETIVIVVFKVLAADARQTSRQVQAVQGFYALACTQRCSDIVKYRQRS